MEIREIIQMTKTLCEAPGTSGGRTGPPRRRKPFWRPWDR